MRKIPIALAAAAGLLTLAVSAAPALAVTSGTVYVSPTGSSSGADTSCRTAGYSDINAAVAAAGSGGTVVVCRGTYRTQVVVTTPLNLEGRPGATINAKGQPPLKIGKTKLPGSIGIGVLGASDVRVSGFHVSGAGFDAILVGLSSHVWVWDNVLTGNGDVGVDVNGSSWSAVSHNISKNNGGGGFLIADDIGPTSHNAIIGNIARNNPGGCGVIVAGHSTAGVTDNLVAGNWLSHNGTLKSVGGGAGVVIATEVPGETLSGNTVIGNHIWGNGLAGVTIHAHLPGQNLNGTRIIGNWISTNNTLGDPIGLARAPSSKKNVAKPDPRTTGILVGTASAIKVQIAGNHITFNHYGIFLEFLKNIAKKSHVALVGNQFAHVVKTVKRVIVS
jgi:nitrous oxidase accessory protein NosD